MPRGENKDIAQFVAVKKAESKSEGRRAGGGREDDSKRQRSGAWSSGSWGSGSWGSGKERDLPQGK